MAPFQYVRGEGVALEPRFMAFDLCLDEHVPTDDAEKTRRFRNGEDTRQVACEVHRHLQFTKSIPSFLAAGLMNRHRILLSRIGFPSLMDWKTKSSGPLSRRARPHLRKICRYPHQSRCVVMLRYFPE